ncbi:MAG TPA: 1-acyl-sn-glycerol-3-phosphate acyltransferase [bacterium]|nr:1-acyl-sn-glycerol-3-phosphate acyltransferase [bacterium]
MKKIELSITQRNFAEKWFRRAATFPLYIVSWWLTFALSPLLLLIALFIDLRRRSRWAALRSTGFLFLYLTAENLAIFLGLGMWLLSGRALGLGKRRYQRWMRSLERWWGGWLFDGVSKLFGLRFDIEGLDEIEHGPALLFFRHVSMPDTSLPGALFVLRRRWHVRHIIKRELLWDPGLDIIGNGLPNFFVRRGLGDNEREIDGVRRVVRDLDDNEAVVIFPEGTRFTASKRRHMLERLKEKGDLALLERARALKNVLPPRLGGCLAMLEENTRACAVFAAHVGFESAARALNVLNGSLIHQTIRINLWHIPFEDIPQTTEERIEWLYAQWRKVDEWIAAHTTAPANGVA